MTFPQRHVFRCGLLLLLQAWSLAGFAVSSPPALKIVVDFTLPLSYWRSPEGVQPPLRTLAPAYSGDFLARSADIRWDDDGHVLVAASRDGTFRLPVDARGHSPLERVLGPLPGSGALGAQVLLGASREYLVAAAPFHLMSWLPRTVSGPKPISTEMDFDTLTDLDVAGDRLLVLGLRRPGKGKLAADGAIAWTAKLGRKLTDVRPVHFSVSGAGAHDMDACADMHMGKVRFLSGGSFVIVPGAEPGIFLHDSLGKLIRTWQADAIGFDAGCPISEQEMYRYSADVISRYQWLNQRSVLDDVLPLPGGIGFLVRIRSHELTSWQLKLLSPEGQVTVYGIPVTSPSPYARLAGDVRGDRIAFLLALDTRETPPAGSTHVFIAEAPRLSGPQAAQTAAAKPGPAKKSLPKRPPKP
ncbi:MAG TPA: hypothetical protein VF173_03940 [Thermoanaerobaculia bacterium]|nr:hypothetical protein [Thermoanaerobaculia bacterium]